MMLRLALYRDRSASYRWNARVTAVAFAVQSFKDCKSRYIGSGFVQSDRNKELFKPSKGAVSLLVSILKIA